MIAVTRLDGSALVVNADLVEWIEQTPDTVIALVNGEKLLVRERPDELVRRVVEYKRAISRQPLIHAAAVSAADGEVDG
jgi:flagellar protein FlbD